MPLGTRTQPVCGVVLAARPTEVHLYGIVTQAIALMISSRVARQGSG